MWGCAQSRAQHGGVESSPGLASPLSKPEIGPGPGRRPRAIITPSVAGSGKGMLEPGSRGAQGGAPFHPSAAPD